MQGFKGLWGSTDAGVQGWLPWWEAGHWDAGGKLDGMRME